jgi:hypothetical protein
MLDVFQCDICTSLKVSGMGRNGFEAPHDRSRGSDKVSANIMLRDIDGAHRFSVLGRWAMYGQLREVLEEKNEDRGIGADTPRDWCRHARRLV